MYPGHTERACMTDGEEQCWSNTDIQIHKRCCCRPLMTHISCSCTRSNRVGSVTV